MSTTSIQEIEHMDTTEPEDAEHEIKRVIQLELPEELPEENTEEREEEILKIPDVVVNPSIPFRCKNNIWGCLFLGNFNKLLEHEQICDYDVDDCPLNTILKCGWRGHEHEFHDHCYKVHPGLKFAPNGRCSLWPNFVNITNKNNKLNLLVLAYRELFYCLAEVSQKDGLVRWIVYYVGDPADASKYCYEIDFEGEPWKKGCYTIKHRCQAVVDGDVSFKEEGCGIMHYKMLKNLCARDELVYYVRIQKFEN